MSKKKATNKVEAWRNYEEVARYLLDRIAASFGLERVEGKQHVAGASGTTWEIDAKGVSVDADTIIVEFRCYTKARIAQEDVSAIAFRIEDTGSIGGIIVSPNGLQSGAAKVADFANIVSVKLNADSTKEHYVLTFLTDVRNTHIGISEVLPKMSDSAIAQVSTHRNVTEHLSTRDSASATVFTAACGRRDHRACENPQCGCSCH